jgi:hypothetical protein
MAWDSSRPVPWKRLIRDWVLYIGIMTVVFLIIYRDRISPGLFSGLLISGPMFLVIGAVLAKFGYVRKTMKDLRAEAATKAAAKQSTPASGGSAAGARPRPAPTKRTSGGSNRPSSKQRRR